MLSHFVNEANRVIIDADEKEQEELMLHNILNKIEASIKTIDWMKKSEQNCNNRSCKIWKLHIIILFYWL